MEFAERFILDKFGEQGDAILPMMVIYIRACIKLKEYDKAMAYCHALESFAKEDSVTLSLRGAIYQGLGEDDKAFEKFKKAVWLSPSSPNALLGIARYWIKKKDYVQAKENLKRAIMCSQEKFEEAEEELARIEQMVGENNG